MNRNTTLAMIVFFLLPLWLAAKPHFGRMAEVCQVSYTAKTQAGEMSCHVAACRLESEVGSGSDLYVVTTCDREYSPRVVRILEGANSPIMEKAGDSILVLFTSGANTTSVAEFSVSKGTLEFVSEEAIAWNDSGIYRTSASFPRYSHLLEKRTAPKRVRPVSRR